MQAKYRLKKNRHFDYVYKKGKSVACRSLVLIYAPNRFGQMQIGFTVGKKLGKAVTRNKIKRRLRAILTNSIPDLQTRFNYVVLARENAVNCSFSELSRDVRYLIGKLSERQNGAPFRQNKPKNGRPTNSSDSEETK